MRVIRLHQPTFASLWLSLFLLSTSRNAHAQSLTAEQGARSIR